MRTSPAPNLAGLKRIDPDMVLNTPPSQAIPNPDEPLVRAVVARGRSVDVVIPGEKIVVGSRPYDVGGTVVFKDVTAAKVHRAREFEEVWLPESEVIAGRRDGFLMAEEDEPPPKKKASSEPKSEPEPDPTSITGIKNDPRLNPTAKRGDGRKVSLSRSRMSP
jgi:hypothetical protein